MGGDSSDRSGITTLAVQGSITFIGKIFGRLVGFSFIVIITKLISPSTFGVYSLGLAIVLLIKSISDLSVHRGIDYFLPKYLSKNMYGQAKSLLAITSLVALSGTGMAMILLWLAAPRLSSLFNEERLNFIIPFLSLALPFLSFRDVEAHIFIAIKKLKYREYMNSIILPVAKLLGTLALLYAGYEVGALVGGYMLSIILVTLTGLAFLYREVGWLFDRPTESIELPQIFSYSLPLVLAGVLYATISQIDFFIIGYYPNTSSEDLAIFKVANLLGANILIFLNSLSPVFKPMVTEAEHDTQLLNNRFALAARWIMLFTLPTAITLIIAPSLYLSLLFTPEYTTGGTALVILVIGYLINSSVGPEGMVLEGLGFTRLTLTNSIVMIGMNTAIDILLVPRIGILGAAIGTSVGMTSAVTLGVLELWYVRGILPFDRRTLIFVIAGTPAVVVGWLSSLVIDYEIILALSLPVIVVTVYLFSLRGMNAFGEEDKLIAKLIDEKLGADLIHTFLIR